MNQYAVWGNPIEHSLSPRIHQLFAEQTNKKISYTAISTNKEEFKAQIFNFLKKPGTKGANVTAPFKELAMEVAEEHSVPCLIAGSCNTLAILDKGILVADNTDGIGLVTDLTRLDWLQPNQKILILGAGGATKGVLYPLLTAKQNITIYNRTSEKAVTLSQKFAKYGEINSTTLDELHNQSFDLIINATSAGLTGQHINIPETLFKNTNVYDMQYASNMNTPFLNYAKQNGANCCQDGLGMLVAQAAYSFYKWEKVMPQIEPVLKQLRTEIK